MRAKILVSVLLAYLFAGIVIGSIFHVTTKTKYVVRTVIITVNSDTISPEVIAAWNKVAWCETHSNWKHKGYLYEGGLGILAYNWKYYGGTQYAPHAWQASPAEQIKIAMRIQNGLPIPDQNGTCKAW